MIYEIRTYNLKPGSVDEMERRVAEKIPSREAYSALFGFWHTEIGPLNQVVGIWPYDDANSRFDVRDRAIAGGDWPPNTLEFVDDQLSEIYLGAPFMNPDSNRRIGPVFEMRTYVYPPGTVPKVLEAWGDAIAERDKLSPLGGCWYTDVGELNKFVHLWGYRSHEERARVRAEARERGIWPPKSGVSPLRMENKILTPASFSRMR